MLKRTEHPPATDPSGDLDRLGDHLVDAGALSDADLRRARRAVAETGERLDRVLVRLAMVDEGGLTDALALVTGLPRIDAADLPSDPPLIDALGADFLAHARMLPLSEDDPVPLAVADPLNRAAMDAIAMKLGRPIVPMIAEGSAIERVLERRRAPLAAEADPAGTEADIAHLRDMASEAPVIRLVNQIIQTAAMARASDIHIDAHDQGLRVRLRVDGALHDINPPPAAMRAAVISRLKIMAGLNIAEQRLPQDGRFKTTVAGRALDLRVATLPVLHGENVVLRLLDRSGLVLDFEGLGFDAPQRTAIEGLIARPNGIVLVTGPTGSGKTTTLYAALSQLNRDAVKIITIEDPVEYELPGVSQIQVRASVGMGFATGLRAILRQNPDIIMVGEIRDRETAEIAIQAALTGHLVLSTLHTNSAVAAIDRLRDMGVDDYLITATLAGVVAQRLARRICPDCAEPEDAALVARVAGTEGTFRRAPGCAACRGTGARGRTSVAEVLTLDGDLRAAFLGRQDGRLVEAAAVAGGMIPVRDHALAKAAVGEIALAEVLRLAVDGA